ncbi:g6492 [Coccomyxa elongata]
MDVSDPMEGLAQARKNCFTYNDSEADSVTRELCSEVKSAFNKRWTEAGLSLDSSEEFRQETPPSATKTAKNGAIAWSSEAAVPPELSYEEEGTELPVRHLDNFQLCTSSDLSNLVPLEDVEGAAEEIIAQGEVIPADKVKPGNKREKIFVTTGPVLDWTIDRSNPLSVWIVTGSSWYRLHTPSPAYASTYTSAQQKVEMCAVTLQMMERDGKLTAGVAAVQAAAELGLDEDHADISFAEEQVSTWTEGDAPSEAARLSEGAGKGLKRKAEPGAPAAKHAADETPSIAENGDEGAADDLDLDDEDSQQDDGAIVRKKKKRRRRRKSGSGLETGGTPLGRRGKLALQREAAAAEAAAEARTRSKREREADAARGPPPEPARSFRLPQPLLPDLLTVWELLQMLAPTPYLPFWRLEAAVCPGPVKAGVPTVPGYEEPGSGKGAEDGKVPVEATRKSKRTREDDLEEEMETPAATPIKLRIKMSAGKHKKTPGSAMPSTGMGYIPPTDDAGLASALVLREVHSALLRGADGKGLSSDASDAPRTAKLAADAAAAAWTGRVSKAILDAPPFAVDDDAREAAVHLAYAEYDDLSVLERIAILRGLSALALSADAVRDYISARLEAMPAPAPPRLKKKEEGEGKEGAKEDEAAPAELAKSAAAATSAGPQKKAAAAAASMAGSAEEWEQWMEASRVGVRRSLGSDSHKRCYWALGGRASAWRVYVEDKDSSLWGWYEGDKLVELVEWLRAGAIEREAPLLDALSQAPLPRKAGAPSHNQNIAAPAGESGAAAVLTAAELEARRWDGYRGLVAPQLRGEGSWPRASLQAAFELRVQAAVDAMLMRMPFWFTGEDRVEQILGAYEAMGLAKTASEMAKALLKVEVLLTAAGVMGKAWYEHWQSNWQRAASYCVDWKHALLLTATLQVHQCRDRGAFSRPAFMRIASEEHCQLYFPEHGDQVVLLRTGLQHHLKKYMQTLGMVPLDDPPQPSPGQQASPPPQTSSPAPDMQDDDEAAEDAGEEDEQAKAVQVPQQLELPLPENIKEEVQEQWGSLAAAVESLRPIERFRVVGLAYRRTMLDGSAAGPLLDDLSEEELLAGGAAWPCTWILLQPSTKGPRHQSPTQPIAVPLRIDNALPDYMVKAELFDKGSHRMWSPGDRFRMYFGGRAGSKQGGVYYRGVVSEVFQQQPELEAPESQWAAYDPWEAVEVAWDGKSGGHSGQLECVNPWELESDPDFERTEGERQREQEAEARALRAQAIALRREAEERAEAEKLALERAAQEKAAMEKAIAGREERARAAAAAPRRASAAAAAAASPAESGDESGPPLYMPVQHRPGDHGAVPSDVLDMLKPLGRERFMTLLTNWHRGVHGKFKVPIFAHQELDLYRVFWSVMDKGGYEIVSANKHWKEVCRCLGVDLRGQTSASFNMRQNYERCLFEFEDYLSTGAYVADINAGRAPSADAILPFQPRHPIAALPVPGVAPTRHTPVPPRAATPPERTVTTRGGEGSSRRVSYRDMLVHDDEEEDADMDIGDDDSPEATPPPVVRRPGRKPMGGRVATRRFGPALHAQGHNWVGKLVLRYWPDQGGWWEAKIGEYSTSRSKHRLIYDADTDKESFEWVDFRELTDEEIKPHSLHPLPLPKPAPVPLPMMPLTVAPVIVPPVLGTTPAQSNAMNAIVTALRAGLERETLLRMVDAASTALHLTEEQNRQPAGSRSVQLPTAQSAPQEAGAAPGGAMLGGLTGTASAAELDGGDTEAAGRTGDGDSAAPDDAAAEVRPRGGAGRISLRIKMKQGGDASSSEAQGRERGARKRGLEVADGTPESEEEEQRQPPRKRHRLANASQSTSPAPQAAELEAAPAAADGDAAAGGGSHDDGLVHGNGAVEAMEEEEEEEVASPRRACRQPDSDMAEAGDGSDAGSGEHGARLTDAASDGAGLKKGADQDGAEDEFDVDGAAGSSDETNAAACQQNHAHEQQPLGDGHAESDDPPIANLPADDGLDE